MDVVSFFFFFSSRRRHTRSLRDWSSDVCSSDLAEGFRVRLTAADDRQAEHMRQILREHDVEVAIAPSLDGAESLAIVVGDCSAGFSIPALGVIVLTEGEVFG